jgi:hypothetical protein
VLQEKGEGTDGAGNGERWNSFRIGADKLRSTSVLCFKNQVRTDRQHIHAGTFKAIDCSFRIANDRLVFIETGIQSHRNSGLRSKAWIRS